MRQNNTRTRPIRSELSIPGNDWRKVEKGLASGADAVFIDLEDSVAPAQKAAARKLALAALTELDWGQLARAVRVNAISTPWCLRDLIAIADGAGEHFDKIVVPKVQSAADVAYVDRFLTQVEAESGRAEPIALEIQIEDAAGLLSIREIAQASPRITELTFGQGDFAAATGMPAAEIGVQDEWDRAVRGDRWLFPRQTIVFTARAFGVRALNGPFAAFRDLDGFRAYCQMSRALGFDGVWCIHPDQIPIANNVFSPTGEDIEQARATVAAFEVALSHGHGAADHGSVMIDEASVRMARSVIERAEIISSLKQHAGES